MRAFPNGLLSRRFWGSPQYSPAHFGGMMRGLPPACGAPMVSAQVGSVPNGTASRETNRASDVPLVGNEVKLFVGGLPSEFSELDLRNVMAPYGNIVDIHVMKPSGSSNQRCAFVTYEHHVSALAATKMNGVLRVNAVDRPIVVRFADAQHNKRQRV